MLKVIPTPKKITEKNGFFDLSGISVICEKSIDRRVVKAAVTLSSEIEEITGKKCPLYSGEPFKSCIYVSCKGEKDSYTLSVRENGIAINADGPSGAFYGIQSLRQLMKENGGLIPFCEIEDTPDFSYRGFYHDVTRGRVPTLENLKKTADILSYYKINKLQLYVEDAFMFKEFEGVITPEASLNAEEILEFDDYCHDRFIELIPSLSTFGHLFTLLQSEKYSCICELEGHEVKRNYWLEKQWHHTVDVYDPKTVEVIGSMIEQYLPLFRSEYFNICCDETMDLCSGKNLGKDKGEAYFYHLEKLINIIHSYGKRVMMWGDECMARPEMSKERLPSDTVILNWCYRKDVNEWIPKFFHELGFSQVCCTGTSIWENFIENTEISTGNISSFARHAKKYGTLGIMNTNWGDFGHICSFNCCLYGLLFGAEKSWNVDSVTDESFETAASLLLYGIKEFNVPKMLHSLSAALYTSDWSRFVIWHSAVTLENKSIPLDFGFDGRLTAENAKNSIEICNEALSALRSLERENDIITDLSLAVRGVSLMNREYLYVNKEEGFCDGEALQKDFDKWLEEYRTAWLRDNKPSGLERLSDFIKKITRI